MLLGLFFLFISTASAAGSVLGIDFGTLNLKAALVKPGIPLEIVLSKDSKRKEVAAVAFKPNRDSKNQVLAEIGVFPERVYGGDALALQGRMPGEVFPNLKPLLGLPWSETTGASDVVGTYKSRYPAVQAQQVKEMGTVLVKSSAFVDSEPPWAVEELLAMELANVRRNAEAMAGKGTTVADAVITVPAFYTADERRAIERAADLAGLNVNALITDGLAVGLDYAKSRTFPEVTKGEKPEYHVVFDMGAGSTTATVLRFQGKSVKDVGRFNKTVQEVAVMGAGWDRTLGGDSLNQVIVEDYVQKFMTKPVLKSRGIKEEEIKSNGRLMSRLWKEAEKARTVLSANAETSSSFEELLPEIDFRTKLSRTAFEELTVDFAERVAKPIESALAAAKLTMKDIDSIILHGGAVRTPFVQRQLESYAGGTSKLRSNVNADESAVFGAAFKGASLSPSFKVKEIRDSDVASYAAGMAYADGGKQRKQQLFAPTSPVGSGAATKQVTFKDKDDFAFGLYQVVDGLDRKISKVQTSNLTDSVRELNIKFGCEKEDISTKFSIRLSAVDGLPEVLAGTVSCQVEGTEKGGSVIDSAKDWLGFGGKKGQEPLKEGEDDGPTEEVDAATSTSADASASTTGSADVASESSSKVPEKPKKRTETINLAFTVSAEGIPQPAPEEIKRMHDRLAAFDRSDKARLAREEALNVLESYTYFVRDFLGNSEYTEAATDSMRSEISKLLENTRSFMESPSDVAKATQETLKEKLSALKKLVEPIQKRRKEELARPEKVEAMRKALEQTESYIQLVKGQVEAAASASKEAEASSSAASSSEPVASSSDDFADLEDAETTTAAPKASDPPSMPPYTAEDVERLEAAYEHARSWFREKEGEQGKLESHEDPVLTVKDLEAEANKLSSVMTDLIYKKIRQQPKPSSSKKPKGSKTKAAKKSRSTAAGDETSSGKAARITINPEDEMLTEEEIESMISKAREGSAQSSTGRPVRDEL